MSGDLYYEKNISVNLSLFGGRIDCFKDALQFELEVEADMESSNFTEVVFRDLLDEVVKLEEANKKTDDMGFDLPLVSGYRIEAACTALELSINLYCYRREPDMTLIYEDMLKEIKEKVSQSMGSISEEKDELKKTIVGSSVPSHANRRRSR